METRIVCRILFSIFILIASMTSGQEADNPAPQDSDDFFEMPDDYEGGTSPDPYFLRAQEKIRSIYPDIGECGIDVN